MFGINEIDHDKERIVTEIGQINYPDKQEEEYFAPGDRIVVHRPPYAELQSLKYDKDSYVSIASPMVKNNLLFVEIVPNKKSLKRISETNYILMENVIGYVGRFTMESMIIQTFPEEVISQTAAYFLKTTSVREIGQMIASTRMNVKAKKSKDGKWIVTDIISVLLIDPDEYCIVDPRDDDPYHPDVIDLQSIANFPQA